MTRQWAAGISWWKSWITSALIDTIVYRLYGLTDEEIELIERPQYEQALTEAKAQVVADEAITDDEEMRDIRNKAAHDEVISRDEAQQIHTWSMKLLGQV